MFLAKRWLVLSLQVVASIKQINLFELVYDGTKYLVLFGAEKYDFIYNRIRYLVGVKSGVTYVISHDYAKIKVDSYDSLPLEKGYTTH